MMKVMLSAGKEPKEILVDDDEFDYVNQWRWKIGKRGYAIRSVFFGITNGKSLYKDITLHRLIMRARPGEIVDHKNQNKLDNRKENLRFCTPKQNQQNVIMYRNNTSGYKGVSWNKKLKKYQAYIAVDGRKLNLGWFNDKKDAAQEYNKAALEYHGEFASLNPIEDDDIQ